MSITITMLALPSAGSDIPTLPHLDALTVPPKTGTTVTLPPDPRPGAEKLASSLRHGTTPHAGTVRIVVLLHEPLELRTQASPAGDGVRVAVLARLEQEFVQRTAAAGLAPVRGLSHLPIVIAEAPPAALEAIASDPAVEAIDPDLPMHAARAEGAALMHADELRVQYGARGAGIGVAILDTGIDITHNELAGQVTAKGNYTSSPGDGTTDVPGHGTAVAGIVAGTGGGMAPSAHLWALKVLDDQGSGSLSALVSALNDVLASHNQFGGVHVVNMSLGGLGGYAGDQPWTGACDNDIPSLATAIDQLVDAGIAVFAAAGNEGCKSGIGWPACIANAISVGAVYDANLGYARFPDGVTCAPGGTCTDSSTAAGMVSCYSNSGSILDIWAPAHCSTTTATGGGYESCFGGTSAAAPYAAGVAAQLYGAVSGLTPARLRNALTTTGVLVTDPGNGVARHLVDAVAAYQALQSGGGGGGNVSWVEWVVHAAGAGGSQWRSDVGFLNRGSAAANLDLTIRLTDGRTITSTIATTVGAGGQVWLEDVLGSLGITGKGSLEIESDQPGTVTARLYNETYSGTFGQFFAGHSPDEGLAAGETAVLPMLRQDGIYRTNISVTNTGSSPAYVTVTLRNHAGGSVGSLTRTVGAGQSYQWTQPFAAVGFSGVGSAVVQVGSGSGIIASASVIDGRTGDPTTITMVR